MSDQSATGSEQQSLIYIYWAACPECGYTTAVHGRVSCPYCDRRMAPYEIAGAVVDDDSRSSDSGGESA